MKPTHFRILGLQEGGTPEFRLVYATTEDRDRAIADEMAVRPKDAGEVTAVGDLELTFPIGSGGPVSDAANRIITDVFGGDPP